MEAVAFRAGGFQSRYFLEGLRLKYGKDVILRNVTYSLFTEDGTTVEGISDENGLTSRVVSAKPLAVTQIKLHLESTQPCCGSAHSMDKVPLTFAVEDIKTNSIDVGKSIVELATPEGASRRLTPGEIAMA